MMMTSTTGPTKPSLSRNGRRARSGMTFALDATNGSERTRDAAATLANVAKQLGSALDAIATDELATPAEKRRAAQAAVAAARKQTDAITTKVGWMRDSIKAQVDALEHVRNSYEGKYTALQVERLKLRAESIRTRGPEAALEFTRQASTGASLDDAVLLGLLHPDRPDIAAATFHKIARPEQLAAVRADIGLAEKVERRVFDFMQGLGDLERQQDAYLGDGINAADMLAVANEQPGSPLPSPVANEWPTWARGTL